jgi:hypothetical protein
MRHANAGTTLDTYGHLWPDADESTRSAIGAVIAEPAKMALAYALDAIDFAKAAIDQAEYAALEALYAQAAADSPVA